MGSEHAPNNTAKKPQAANMTSGDSRLTLRRLGVAALILLALAGLAWWQGWFDATPAASPQAEAYYQHRYHGAPLPTGWTKEEAEENLDQFLDDYLDPKGLGEKYGYVVITAFYACRDGKAERVKEMIRALKAGGLPQQLLCKMLDYFVSGGCISAEEAKAFAESPEMGLNCNEAQNPGDPTPERPGPTIPGLGGK